MGIDRVAGRREVPLASEERTLAYLNPIARYQIRTGAVLDPTGGIGQSVLVKKRGFPEGIVGIDIGGTKTSVSIGTRSGVLELERYPTVSPVETLDRVAVTVNNRGVRAVEGVGVACGEPLDVTTGCLVSPPNLPAWHGVAVVDEVRRRLNAPVWLMNDANANALAEWQFGAGQGLRHIVYLTAGTGMGAGLILNGQLFEGATGDAGEIGHVRLRSHGPMGYGKAGSFEGCCSGGGIPGWFPLLPSELSSEGSAHFHRNTGEIAEAARQGDVVARAIFNKVAATWGGALAWLVDVLNPQAIILGSLYVRCRDLLEEPLRRVLNQECLPRPLSGCRILPAALGEQVGNVGALCVALHGMGLLATGGEIND